VFWRGAKGQRVQAGPGMHKKGAPLANWLPRWANRTSRERGGAIGLEGTIQWDWPQRTVDIGGGGGIGMGMRMGAMGGWMADW
jgi:hypothetical protein